jgi:16S rRNA processing protein RimM
LSPSERFLEVGKVKDAHGIKGELFLVLFSGEAAWLDQLKDVRLVSLEKKEVRNLTVKSVRPHKNGLILKSHEILNRNDAEGLKGFLLEIPETFLVSAPGETMYLQEVLGFRVFTEAQGEVGVVKGFASHAMQDLLVVKTASGDFDIPFVDAFVVEIDHEKKEMHLDLPLGLLGELDGEDEEPDDLSTDSDEESAGNSID